MSYYNNLILGALTCLLALIISVSALSMLFHSKFDPRGKFCYITGGSSGLGRAIAIILVKRGASVTIVAREVKKLAQTEALLQSLAGPSQVIATISADLTSSASSDAALVLAMERNGGNAPDHVFLCAGFSRPKFFVDTSSEELQSGFDGTFWVSAWTAHTAAKQMVSQRVRGSIVFVSSFLGYTSFAGYSTYSPGKYALRGLADALRSEMLLHQISVHIFMPAGIDTAGLAAENASKPEITRKIEEGDKVISAEECAGHLLRGLEKGYYQPTSYFVTDLMRMQSRGAVPGNDVLLDTVYWLVSGIGVPIWRMITDAKVRGHRGSVEADLQARGFYQGDGTGK